MTPSTASFTEILNGIAERAQQLLLQTAVALVVAAVVVVIGQLLRPLVRRHLRRRGRPSHTRVFTALYRISVVTIAVLLALTLAFPSVRVADVLASLGILSVAVGFAFKDVLENLLAGVLLLLRDPFKSGDQIRVGDAEGTVEGVTVRETLLRTYDGQLVLIPNAQVYTSPLEVRTHYPYTRVSYSLRFPTDTDFDRVHACILDILRTLTPTGAPGPDTVVTSVQEGAVEVEARLWSQAARSEITSTLHEAITATLEGLAELGVRLDEPAVVVKMPRSASDQGSDAAR